MSVKLGQLFNRHHVWVSYCVGLNRQKAEILPAPSQPAAEGSCSMHSLWRAVHIQVAGRRRNHQRSAPICNDVVADLTRLHAVSHGKLLYKTSTSVMVPFQETLAFSLYV